MEYAGAAMYFSLVLWLQGGILVISLPLVRWCLLCFRCAEFKILIYDLFNLQFYFEKFTRIF